MLHSLILLIPIIFAGESERYLGIPIGTIDDADAHLSAEVFVADEHTIGFDKLSHDPIDASCVAVMIGPARDQDRDIQIGPGVMLPYAQMDFHWEDLRVAWKRKKRESRKSVGIEEMIDSLAITNPRWRIRLNQPTPSASDDDSYEIVEYVDDEEETEEREEHNLIKKEFGHKLKETTSTEPPTTMPLTTAKTTSRKTFTITTTKPVIVFNKTHSNKLAQQKIPKGFPTPPQTLPTMSTPTTQIHLTSTTRASTAEVSSDVPDEFLEPVFEDMESLPQETTTVSVSKDLKPFIIPHAIEDQAIFLLTNGAKITDYKWLGLWNDCTRTSTPHIWLADVDPPREEEIPPLTSPRGEQFSAPIRILNCNTILVQKLQYKPDPKMLNTYFFVGTVGANKQERKTKIKVVGYDIAEPLEEFAGDDIMLRLPKGIRTFDIDFLCIHNEDTGETLAKTEVPSFLVPPCNV